MEIDKSGQTIKEVSTALDIPYTTLASYYQGKRTPRSPDMWEKLADYFDVPVPYLMGYGELEKDSDHSELRNVLTDYMKSNNKDIDFSVVMDPILFLLNELQPYSMDIQLRLGEILEEIGDLTSYINRNREGFKTKPHLYDFMPPAYLRRVDKLLESYSNELINGQTREEGLYEDWKANKKWEENKEFHIKRMEDLEREYLIESERKYLEDNKKIGKIEAEIAELRLEAKETEKE